VKAFSFKNSGFFMLYGTRFFCSIMHTKTCDIILKSKLLAMTSPVAASLAGGSNGEGIAKIALQSKIKTKKGE
jgi:hypothetical protein